jgi:hypothetical protein
MTIMHAAWLMAVASILFLLIAWLFTGYKDDMMRREPTDWKRFFWGVSAVCAILWASLVIVHSGLRMGTLVCV